MGMLGSEVFAVSSVCGERNFAAGVAGGGLGEGCRGSSVEPAEVALTKFGFFGDVDFDNFDRFGGTSLHTGGGFSFGEPVVTHVAFADDPSFFRKFRNVEGAFEDAIGASNTLVVEVTNDSGFFGFLVGLHRAAVEAFRVGAVVASSGDGLLPTRFFLST